MRFLFIEKEIPYMGVELSPHWIYDKTDIQGDAVVSFVGECRVELENMVDLQDVKAKDSIYSPKMLNFIAEFFDDDLEKAIYRQRLLITAMKEELESAGIPDHVIRQGDDLYHVDHTGVKRKMTVSIATKSIVSTLIHAGINIRTEGTPVKTAGLAEFDIDPATFASRVMERFILEIEDIRIARSKVRPV
ncbi:MAG: DUF366 family protein [Candidatus Eremiobacteraeota bacterium]|nr:DUF366 family protein [Candidatus Eremiobacteraeota bacterium]